MDFGGLIDNLITSAIVTILKVQQAAASRLNKACEALESWGGRISVLHTKALAARWLETPYLS
jgi:hypothetical protein